MITGPSVAWASLRAPGNSSGRPTLMPFAPKLSAILTKSMAYHCHSGMILLPSGIGYLSCAGIIAPNLLLFML